MRILRVLVVLMVIFTTAGCKDDGLRAGRYGMMSDGTPQYTALKFTQAIYQEKSLEPALALTTKRFGKVVAAYHTPRNVQRQIFNIRFDEVEAEVVAGGTLLGTDSRKDAEIEIKLDGQYMGERKWDLKTILLVKESGNWKVAAVKEAVP